MEKRTLVDLADLSLTHLSIWIFIKTDSPKQAVTIVHFTTISGYFLDNPFNIFHTTEALLIQND